MENVRKDLLGNTPSVGDIIVFNPPRYKGLVHGVCIGFSSGGLPKVNKIVNVSGYVRAQLDREGFYTPKTGFVCVKS